METLKKILKYPLYLLVSVVVIVVGTLLLLGGRDFDLGGILSSLWGGKNEQSRVEIANEVPEDREESKGEVDEKGWEQVEVKEKPSGRGIFRDRGRIAVEGGKGEIPLPEGVRDTDVDKVYKTDPDTYKITVKNRPKKRKFEDLLKSLE